MTTEELKKEEESQKEEEQTSPQNDSTEEKNDSQPEEDTSKTKDGEEHEEEYVPPTKEELEKLKRKANDFDGLLEKQRLKKLAGETKTEEKKDGESPLVDEESIKSMVTQQVNAALEDINKSKVDDNLRDVYREFVRDNTWADNDEVMAKISENFDKGVAISKEDLRVKLDVAAQSTYPSEYKLGMENKIKSEILAAQNTIDVGDAGGGGASVNKTDGIKKTLTKEQIQMAERSGNKIEDVYPEYFNK